MNVRARSKHGEGRMPLIQMTDFGLDAKRTK